MKIYSEMIQSLFSRRPTKKRGGQEIESALKKIGNPHLAYPTIHIAGTNGKGQVSVKIARTLEASGYRVGLFISPHVFEYEERITINQVKIPKEKVVEYNGEIMALMKERSWQLNFFECTFLMASRYFAENNVDVAVFEAGIGGRFDTTSCLIPLVSVITSVSKDHTELLGESLEEIAWEKAGVIKPNTPVVIGPRAKYEPIVKEAMEKNAPLFIVERRSCFYDTENIATAREALSVVSRHFSIEKKGLAEGLKACLPCRFEKKGNVIYDVAHNPDSFYRLADALGHLYPMRKFRFVVGMSQTKDLRGSLEKIVSRAHHFHFVQSGQPQSAAPEELAKALKTLGDYHYSIEPSVYEGVKNAKAATPKGEILVVCGSFYIMPEGYRS